MLTPVRSAGISIENIVLEELRRILREQEKKNKGKYDKDMFIPHYKIWKNDKKRVKVMVTPIKELTAEQRILSEKKGDDMQFLAENLEEEFRKEAQELECKRKEDNKAKQEELKNRKKEIAMKEENGNQDENDYKKYWTSFMKYIEKLDEDSDASYAKTFYKKQADVIMQRFPVENYYEMLTQIIVKYSEYWLGDMEIARDFIEYRREVSPIRVAYKSGLEKPYDIETGKICTWFQWGINDILSSNVSLSDKTNYAKKAEKRIKDEKVFFPFKFNNYVDNEKAVIYEGMFLQLQSNMIYDDKLRNLFKEKDIASDVTLDNFEDKLNNIKKSPKYSYKNILTILRRLENDPDIGREDFFLYIVEKIFRINLLLVYDRYYEKIMDTIPDKKARAAEIQLNSILKEFIQMPNVFSRVQIVKEFMEPVLYWEEVDTLEQLWQIREAAKKLKEYFIQIEENMRENSTLYQQMVKELKGDCRFQTVKHEGEPFLFVKSSVYTSKYFEKEYKYIMQNKL